MMDLKEPFLMRALTYDSVALATDTTTYNFFKDEDDTAGSRYNSEIETKIIKWVLDNPFDQNRSLFFDELGIPRSYKCFTEVKEPVVNDGKGPGDIDILAVDQNQQHLAIGIQVKRLKATVNDDDSAHIKTAVISKGVEQARFMFTKYQFHKNYLMLVTVADTHHRKNGCQVFRNLTLSEKMPIYQHPSLKELPDEVGVFTYEISQPSINPVHFTGTIASKLLRPAKPVDQLSSTTESIGQFIRMQEY